MKHAISVIAISFQCFSLQSMSLIISAEKNKEATQELVRYFISNISAKTLLHKAKELLEQGADANVTYPHDWHLLEYVSRSEDSKMPLSLMKLLIEHGAEVNAENGINKITALHCVSSAQKALLLLRHGAQVNKAYKGFNPPIVWCNPEAMPVLFAYGATLPLVENMRGNEAFFYEMEAKYKNYKAFIEFKRGMLGLKPFRDELNKLEWSENINGRKLYAARRNMECCRLPDEIVAYIGEFLGYPEPKTYTAKDITTFKEDDSL